MAAVDLGRDEPTIAAVLQVTDASGAEAGLTALMECGGEASAGWVFDGDWMVLAETDAIAEEIVAQSAEGSLSDDRGHRRWTERSVTPAS